MGESRGLKASGALRRTASNGRFVPRAKGGSRTRRPLKQSNVQVDPPARQIQDSLRQILAAIESGQRPEDVMTARTVRIADPATYRPAEVKALRQKVGASQAVFARMLGVSPELVQHWEQGLREPSGMARRLLDQIKADPSAFLAGLVRR